MPRLFWKFFIIVWLAMTLTTMLGVSIAWLNTPQFPGAMQFERNRKLIVALLTERLSHQDGLQSEDVLKNALPEVPDAKLDLIPATTGSGCGAGTDLRTLIIPYADRCYRVILPPPPAWSLRHNWHFLLPWITAVVASLFSAFVLGKYLITPVNRLRKGLRALAEGHFDIRIHDAVQNRNDEIAVLTKDFDISASRLQELHDSRQRLFHDISHELRSPLSRLQAVIGILRKNPGRLPGLLDRMDREIERLDGLVGEVLTLARLSSTSENGDEKQVIDILDLVDNIVQDAAFEASDKGVTIAFTRNGQFVAAVNGELIYRAIENVIRNAVKYTANDTSVTVAADTRHNQLYIVVTDQGPGVPLQDLESIFRPFTSSGATGSSSGYGLGLAIAKTALKRHGGDVIAANGAEGGLTVTISLPQSAERG
ncbi:signal transduction histidine kinase [Agrobacterium vitis]|nr:signal transduction histidine kinase [Agrobacterium vitis]MBE1437832.1 signal transduction histidine kinase [Agrobacterium vitis]